jgi:outer membrane protein
VRADRFRTGTPLWLLTLLTLLAVPARASAALTLDDYFDAALKRSETVAIQGELIKQAEERYRQASAALWPTVSVAATYTRQEMQPKDDPPARQRMARVTATQPLFRGMREFAGLRQTRSLIDAQTDDYRRARALLFQDVADNFYNILSLEQDLANFDEQIELNLKRENELRERARIGRSRAAEVLTVQASVSNLRAEVEQLRGELHAAREAFAFLSGLDAGTALADTESLPATLAPLDTYLAGIEQRPDVNAEKQRTAAANENVSIARGERLPSLDLNANRYLKRDGTLEDVDWDVQLALTIPLFTGGGAQAKVNEALSRQTQAELTTQRTRRQAEQEIRAAYQNALVDRPRLEALEKATEAARKNYEAQLHDYRLSLVTNLDVLQALTSFQENQRALHRARYAIKLNAIKLDVASARRPAMSDKDGARETIR